MIHISNELQEKYIQPVEKSYKTPSLFSSKTPIVGRQRELAFLMNHYEAAKNGRTQVVVVSGEAGIGKTCLLGEVARRASLDGAVILHGDASDAEGMPPYLPFLEALGHYICHTAPEQLQKQITPATQILTSILPEMPVLPGVQPALCRFPPEQRRFRLQKAVGEFLENIAQSQTLVLVFDDFQWADSASLDLLCSITRHHLKTRLLILSACRDSDLNRNVLLEHAFAELTRQHILTLVKLPFLTRHDIAELARNRLGGSTHAEVCSLLYKHSEGNPFFAEEFLQSWIEEATIMRKDSQWTVNALDGQALPLSIVRALHQRFIQLSPESIRHLRIAATIGRVFPLPLLAIIAEQEMETLEESLLEAEQAGIVQSVQSEVFTFCHDKIRECLYAEVSALRRRRFHEAIGYALESLYYQKNQKRSTQFATLVFCLMQHTELEQDCFSVQPGERQQKALAREVVAHYRAAIELFPKGDQRRSHLLQRLEHLAQDAQLESAGRCVVAGNQAMHKSDLLLFASLKTQGCPPSTPQKFSAHLTRREVAVLKLVACGKSNSQIARELTLSEKTIANHLTHIFNKTGSENRAAATAFAIHHGLA